MTSGEHVHGRLADDGNFLPCRDCHPKVRIHIEGPTFSNRELVTAIRDELTRLCRQRPPGGLA